MELRHLKYFVAVAETENVSRAAARLHVSQPALSRQIRDLEGELGFPLLYRSAKSVRLTDAGRVFLEESRAVLRRAEDAVAAARKVATGGDKELHVGYAPSPTVRILPPTLRAFQAGLPNVRVRLHDLSTEEMLAGLREGTLHLAVLVRPTRAMLRGLRFEVLQKDPIRVAIPPGHPFAKLRSVTLNRVAAEPLVAFSRKDYPEYHELLGVLFEAVGAKPKIAEEHESSPSLVAAVEAGCGVAVMPESLACSVGPRLRFVKISPEPPPLAIGVAWLDGNREPAVDRFVDAARRWATPAAGSQKNSPKTE